MIEKKTPLNKILKLAPECRCKACENGCRFGSGILADGDLENIAEFLKISKEELKEKFLEETEQFNKKLLRPKILRQGKPYGRCIFFDDKKGCKINKVKPLQCKIAMGCKPYGKELTVWFMLNHILDLGDPEAIRQYAIYLKTNKTIPGGELRELVDKEKLDRILKFDII